MCHVLGDMELIPLFKENITYVPDQNADVIVRYLQKPYPGVFANGSITLSRPIRAKASVIGIDIEW